MKHLTLTFTLIILCITRTFATAQEPDVIRYKGVDYALFSNPLESYFEKNPTQRPQSNIIMTSLWRGYVATFEVEESQLFVTDIQIMKDGGRNDGWKSVMKEVFPKEKRVKTSWFSGLLIIPKGKLLEYTHMDYASIYENYIILEVSNGNVLKSLEMSAEEYKDFLEKQFQAFKKTDEYKKHVEELMVEDSTYTKHKTESFLRLFVTDYTSKILIEENPK